MRKTSTSASIHLTILIYAVSTILTVGVCLSNPMLGNPDTRTVPYDGGSTDDLPSAAARMCDLRSFSAYGGCSYAFDIEAFETSWKPIYSIQIEELGKTFMDAISWPDGWTARRLPPTLASPNTTVFITENNPILPGTVLPGFAIVSYSGTISFRWYPADQEGILIGKATRVELGCATGTESSTWGSIKAIYR